MNRSLGNANKSCGPSRTEAEHHQPGFGEVKMTAGRHRPALPTAATTTAAEILESPLSPLG